MKQKNKEVCRWIAGAREDAVRFLQSMIREPSTQMNEAGIQAMVAGKLEELGFAVDVWEPGGESLLNHADFISPRASFRGSPNVAGVKKGRGGGRSLVLNGHVDVVPEGDLKDWTCDPYGGEYKNGKVYGRGATDMKGGSSALLLAVEALKECGVELKGDLIFHSVIEEESGGAGTLAAIVKGYTGDAALIPEPTGMKIFPKQQGSVWFRLHVKGRSAHGGTRYEGVSAIEKSKRVLDVLSQLERKRNERISDPLFDSIPIPVPINVGVIEGGEWPSSVPDLVRIEGRFGIAPDENINEAKREFVEAVAALGMEDGWFAAHPVEVEWFGARWLPGSVDTEHPLLGILENHFTEVMGERPAVEASPWGTDGGLLTAAGQTPTVVFGPGVTSMAHYADEYIEVDKVISCAQIIALTIMDWCGRSEEEDKE
ncbi:peptidase [Alteribacter natronophilus]|uniref:peptidase n=1 Tax=Alteribacter natronophilus TaxID=2583810 RepID=UPI00110DC52F|nr:peptidase [Alteribacter natronophilus]TMW73514.1 peptidase [Alteribacter natronophilus]